MVGHLRDALSLTPGAVLTAAPRLFSDRPVAQASEPDWLAVDGFAHSY